jgi:NAD(P)-dependent dehydrogenase (short-subunit alcohol dehydrogenase family)
MIADLTGKTALVTGGGQGIGRGISLILAAQGADVAIGDVNVENASNVSQEVTALNTRGMALRLDVTSQASANEAVSRIIEEWGHLDILVNNAGVDGAPGMGDGDEREEDWDVTFNINVKGVVHCANAVEPHFTQRRYGKVINIASVAGRAPRPTGSHYAASKAAVISYTRSLAARWAPHDVNVNGIAPGRVWTPFHQGKMAVRQRRGDPALASREPHDVFVEDLKDVTPLGRGQTPEDIGKLAAFLASDDAGNITGQTIGLDGGMVMV